MTNTTCPYCGVGCGLTVTPAAIIGDESHPANHGKLCIKGATLAQPLDDAARLLHPAIAGSRAGWDEALDLIAEKFAATIAAHGPDSVAIYGSGQFLTEDYYVANKLMKGFIGSANIDTNSRLCMSSTVAGHIRAFGEDIVPGCYEDIDEADLLVFVGANAAWCHPVLFERAQANRAMRGAKIVVVDPRRTATAALADLHLPIRPDADIGLFQQLLCALADHNVLDAGYIKSHTRNFAETLEAARADATELGIPDDALATFFDWFAATPRTVTLFSQGVNQSESGTGKVNAIINVHLATGRIGRAGAGPFSLTGQPNAMGGREVGGLANLLAAHLRLDDPAHRAIARDFWRSPRIAQKPGLKAVDMFDAVLDGRIKAIWIAATNPAESLPRAGRVRAALQACDHAPDRQAPRGGACGAAGRRLGRKERHGDEFRAHHLPPAPVSRPAGRGQAGLVDVRAGGAAPWPSRLRLCLARGDFQGARRFFRLPEPWRAAFQHRRACGDHRG